MAWEKLGQSLCLLPLWDNLLLWVCPDVLMVLRALWSCVVAGSGLWSLVDSAVNGSVLAAPLSWLLPAHLVLPLSRQGRSSLFMGIPSFLARCGCAGTARSPLTSCKPCGEVSFPAPTLGIGMVPWHPLPLPDESQWDPLPKEATHSSAGPWGCSFGIPTLPTSWPGPVYTCLWFIRKMKPPTTGSRLGINLKTPLGLDWKKSRV